MMPFQKGIRMWGVIVTFCTYAVLWLCLVCEAVSVAYTCRYTKESKVAGRKERLKAVSIASTVTEERPKTDLFACRR